MVNADRLQLDCPHYVHDYEYNRISEEIKNFLQEAGMVCYTMPDFFAMYRSTASLDTFQFLPILNPLMIPLFKSW